ncbi:MAG: hypothetical protein AAFX85_03855 [Pseudomonadota bacterium]
MSQLIESLTERLFKRRPASPSSAVLTEGMAEHAVSSSGPTDERLMALFKNRAELKKAFSVLELENEQLRDQLARFEGSPVQEERKLAALEQRLSERETAYPALVYYQLRSMWRYCHSQLVEFSEQLQEQHGEREYETFAQEFREEQNRQLITIDERIKLVKAEYARHQAALNRLRESVENLKGFWNHFRRKRLAEQVEEQQGLVAEVRRRLKELDASRTNTSKAAVPKFPGLSSDAQRNINLAVLAFAQYLYVAFSEHTLSALGHAAMSKPVGEVSYGSQADCEALMSLIERSIKAMVSKRGYADELRVRARHLKLRSTFASQDDTIPRPECLAQFPLDFHDGTAGVQVDVNVLEEDYWHVRSVLLG